ncbi:MAG TPA: pitrilysin family protein [Nitrospirota bacterium]|nr:pitrilysin family protein [Nitrospirota bacterium]
MYRKDTLANGIRVVSETLPKSRSISIGVWVKVGSRHEPKELGGISHFIEHLFFKGTKKRTAKDIAIEMDSLGGEMNAFTSQETTTYYVKVLDEHLPKAVDLLSDILLGSRFDPAELEKERKVILEEIKGVEDTPDDYIHELFINTVWPDHPLGRPILGTRETIKALTHKDILAYIEQYYSPREIVISVAGNFEHGRLIELLNAHFGALTRTGIPKQEATPAFTHAIAVKKKQLEQVQVCLGCKGINYTHEDRFVISALNGVLGSSMSSRLFQEVREQNALAYSIYSYLASYRDTGLLTVYAGTDPSNALQAVQLVIKEMKKIKDEGITAAEESRVKNQIKGNLVLSLESSNSHMSRLARQEIFYGKYLSVDDIIKGVEKVTTDQVQRIAQQLFTAENISLAILGPLSRADVPDSVLEI